MKLFVSLCFLAVIASALADCGCLKCNPNLQIVSPKYSPCKVIYRGANSNCASASPYLLQAALPPPPPVFVPKEYDYQIQLIPIAQRPDYTSVYEYGLQAAVVPPPVYTPLKNLRSATERVVLDSPACGSVCGGYGNSNCNTGYVQQAPLPAKSCSVPVPICYQAQQECDCRGPIIEPLCPSLAPRI
ncbi:hypothetical protein HHI36_022079 [Cryptolaemus montrouzieri]|uniref:Uncharacterized protein n=1 Tax=Cryptolaemus montrouzieri TaxID=559131 RepID=A0ABD2MYX7_9CUCU